MGGGGVREISLFQCILGSYRKGKQGGGRENSRSLCLLVGCIRREKCETEMENGEGKHIKVKGQ